MEAKTIPSAQSLEVRQAAKRKRINWPGVIGRYTILIALAASFLLPFYWMASSALKDDNQVFTAPPRWIPNPAYIVNFWNAWNVQNFNLFAFNTIVKYAIPSTIGTVLSSALVAYSFARLRWPGRDTLFAICLATMMIPFR